MRMGIYGDSFAYCTEANAGITWYNMLQYFISNSTVKSYGERGTSVFYSYKKFLETHHEFDKIIFLVTNSDRYTKLVEYVNGTHQYFPHINMVENVLHNDTDLTTIDKKIINDLKGWFLSTDTEYNLVMTELMIRDMEKIHNDIIFFPCFPVSLTDTRKKIIGLSNEVTLFNLCNRQTYLLGKPDLSSMSESPKYMSCHLTEEFNLFVAKLFANKIINNTWNWEDLYKVELSHDLNYYYEKDSKL